MIEKLWSNFLFGGGVSFGLYATGPERKVKGVKAADNNGTRSCATRKCGAQRRNYCGETAGPCEHLQVGGPLRKRHT